MDKEKEYDYWLIVWTNDKGEKTYSPTLFQKELPPKPYCEEIIKQKHYEHYEIYKMLVGERLP